jgi:MFS family permease
MTSVDRRDDVSREEAAVPGEVRRWRAFWLLAVAFLMTVVDLAITNVALPTIGRKLHFPQSDLQWVVTAYALTFGGFLLLGGRAADLLGRRRLFMAGLALFTGASLACALATGDTFLILMRGIQGLGAAVVVPAALSIVMNMFREGADRNKALGIWGGIGAAGATIGVLAGGLLTRYAGWQYIFYLNVPIGAAALLLARRVVPESRLRSARRRYDVLGAVTVTGALVMLVYAISQAPTVGWTAIRTLALLAASAALLAGFLVLETRAKAPLLPSPVPAEGPGRFERRRLPARGQLLRVHLHRHPVHAAGARVLSPEDRDLRRTELARAVAASLQRPAPVPAPTD